MTSSARINVSDVVDQSRLRAFQMLVLVLCGLCMIMAAGGGGRVEGE